VLLDGGRGHHQRVGDAEVRFPFGNLGQDLTLSPGQLLERSPRRTPAPKHAADDLGIESASSGGNPRDGISERLDVADAFLQQIADALRALTDQVQGVALLVVAREHDSGLGQTLAQLERGAQPVRAAAGWHLDVDDRNVRPVRERLAQEVRSIASLTDNLETGFRQKPRDPLSKKNVVFGNHDPGAAHHAGQRYSSTSNVAAASPRSAPAASGRWRAPPWR
jgi:hypothetical protein